MNAYLTKRKTEESEQCKKTIIVSTEFGEKSRVSDNRLDYCQRNNQPFVQIEQHKKTATILMELPSHSRLLDDEGAAKYQELCSEYNYVPEYAFHNPYASKFPRDKAEEFAAKLVQIGENFCMRHKPWAI